MPISPDPAGLKMYASSADATTHTISSWGFTPAAGSLLVLIYSGSFAGLPNATPTGWTDPGGALTPGVGEGCVGAFYKISDGTETSVTLGTWGSNTALVASLTNWTGPRWSVFVNGGDGQSTTPTNAETWTSTAGALNLGLFGLSTGTDTWTSFTNGYTELAETVTTGGTAWTAALVRHIATGTNETTVGTSSGSHPYNNFNISFRADAPITPKFVCGAECGIAVVGTLSAGIEHWFSLTGTGFSVVTSGPSPMRSTRCFRLNTTAATLAMRHDFATAVASVATTVMRAYVYFATLPSANCTLFAPDTGSPTAGPVFKQSDSKIYAAISTTLGATGVSVTTGVWYRIDVKIDRTANTVDVQVDGTACGTATSALADQSNGGFYLGHQSDTVTADYYIDDIVVSGTSADYPIGAGTVVGLYPNGDRTNSSAAGADGNGGHFYSATTDFAKGASGAVATAAQNAESTSWQSLQNPLSTTIGSTWIADLLGGGTEWMVWTLSDLPGNAATVNGVMVVGTVHAASATQCLQTLAVTGVAGGAAQYAWQLLDLSESTITVPVAVIPNAVGGVPWTVQRVNDSFIRWGESSDVNPDPYLDGVCMEVDYVPTTPNKIIQVNQAVQRAAVR